MDPTLSFDESIKQGDWNPEAEIVEHHMKAHSFEKRCIAYITENFRVNDGTIEVCLFILVAIEKLLISKYCRSAYI